MIHSPKGGGEQFAVLLGQLPKVPDLRDHQPDDPAVVAAGVRVELGVGGDVIVPHVGVVNGEPLFAKLLHLRQVGRCQEAQLQLGGAQKGDSIACSSHHGRVLKT